MKIPWSIAFWYQLKMHSRPPAGKGIITSYDGIAIFLTVNDLRIGINDGTNDYMGPTISGLENAPWIFYCLTKDISSISLYLNGNKVLEMSEGKVVSKIDTFHAEVSDTKNFQVIEQDLSSWIAKRESTFKVQQTTCAKYLLLSPTQQETQLQDRVNALGTMLHEFNAGKYYFFEDILANLRALVFYKPGSKNFDPLLLRIAAFKSMVLPVYVIPMNNEIIADFTSKDTKPAILSLGVAAFEPNIPNRKMTDFQDFLEKPAFIYNDQVISPLDLIEKAADTQSTAHFDQRSPIVLEDLKDTPSFFRQNILKQHVLSLAELVFKLGN